MVLYKIYRAPFPAMPNGALQNNNKVLLLFTLLLLLLSLLLLVQEKPTRAIYEKASNSKV